MKNNRFLRKWLPGFCLLVVGMQASAGVTTEFNYHFSELGSGLRSFQESFLANRCVSNGKLREGASNTQRIFGLKAAKRVLVEEAERQGADLGYRVEYTLHQIKDSEDLYSSLGLSVGARLKAEGIVGAMLPGNGEAKLDFAANHRFKNERDYFLVKVKVRGQTVALSNKRRIAFLPAYVQQPGESANSYVSRILLDCGDVYFHSYVLGGELYGLIETASASKVEKKKWHQGIGAALSFKRSANADLSSQINASLAEIITGEVKQIWMIQSGGSAAEAVPVKSIEALSEKAAAFPTFVEHAPVPMEAFYQDYTELFRNSLIEPYSQQANEVIAKFHQNQGLYGRLGVIMSEWVQFDNKLEQVLEKGPRLEVKTKVLLGRALFKKESRRLSAFIQDCSLDYLNCDLSFFIASFEAKLSEAKKNYLPKAKKPEPKIIFVHTQSAALCEDPLTVDDVFEHMETLDKIAPAIGIEPFESRCLIVSDNKGSSSFDLSFSARSQAFTADVGQCEQAGLKNLIVLSKRRRYQGCKRFVFGCKLACFVKGE